MQLGVCASPENVPWIKDAGADYLEANVQTVLAPMDKARRPPDPAALALPIAAYNCFLPGDLRVTGPDVDLGRLLAYGRRAFERAGRMGSTIIVFGSGDARRIPDGWPRARAEEQFIEALRLLGPLAHSSGIVLALEPLRQAETNFINTFAEGLGILRRAAAPGVAMLVDLYHLAAENEPLAHLDEARGLLVHVHLAEPDGRGPPGPGKSDFRPFLAELKSLGYDARLSLECGWKDVRTELGPALDFLRDQWSRA